MNLKTHKTLFLILVAFFLAITAGQLTAQVYKVVDEEGNVIYTDTPPADGSKPIELRPISVIEAPTYEQTPRADEESSEGEDAKEMSIGYLRKNYKDFAIVAPKQEESIWNPQKGITVAWNVGYRLQEGMQVTVFLDGTQQATTSEQIIPLTGLERGEHTITAELKDAKNRKIASAEPVTFFIRQPTIYNRRPNRRPGGG
jgi:hypothetical protein